MVIKCPSFHLPVSRAFYLFVFEGSHDIQSMRDMRDALGALGPVDGQNPELNNLTCSMTVIEEGDIVFLTSDGVSDNFDPVVGKFVVARKPDKIVPLPNSAKQTTKPPNRSITAFSYVVFSIKQVISCEQIYRRSKHSKDMNSLCYGWRTSYVTV